MALTFISTEHDRAWGIWHVSESEESLSAEILPFEQVPPSITNATKRLEFLAGRALLKRLLQTWNYSFEGLMKDEFGKPFFKNLKLELSLSHSYPYVAAIICDGKPVGIDLEQPKQKLLSVASRVLHPLELQDAGLDIVKHCIYWCSKESLIKFHGKKDLTFSENLLIEPFERAQKGSLVGRIVAKDIRETIPLDYHVYDNFVVTHTV
jgi:4'-phosphopantetheinyl transferase